VLVLVLAASAGADDEPPPTRDLLKAQLSAEAALLETTTTTVGDKLRALDTVRTQRLRAAYRTLREQPVDLLAARRRAAARLLVDRDRAERALLVDELAHLAAATERTVTATKALPRITLPESIVRPANGTIARRFGTIEHERSKAILARRGLDLEVEAKAAARAPAAGTVRYAGPIRGLDDGVILDHGDYFTVVAKLGELAVSVGARVEAGDRLGRAARHRVYLEVRVKVGPGGLPIDPEPLLASSDTDSR
jgi:septal ring factor EnvC (AmiA/AmiB activator)